MLQLEKHFADARDIEWAVCDDTIYLLQVIIIYTNIHICLSMKSLRMTSHIFTRFKHIVIVPYLVLWRMKLYDGLLP